MSRNRFIAVWVFFVLILSIQLTSQVIAQEETLPALQTPEAVLPAALEAAFDYDDLGDGLFHFFSTDTEAGNTYQWILIQTPSSTVVEIGTNKDFTYQFSDPGTYEIILTASHNGASSTAKANISVSFVLTANFSVDILHTPLPMIASFTNLSEGNIDTYAWDFNSDSIVDSTDKDPQYEYTEEGQFVVHLTVAGPAGTRTATANITIDADEPPTLSVSFIASPAIGTAPLTVNFTQTSSGDNLTYAWDFGDSGTTDVSSLANPSYTYLNPGTYYPTLTIKNAQNQSATTSGLIIVNKPVEHLHADFTPSKIEGTAPLEVKFTEKVEGTAEQFNWYFGDGGEETQFSPTHVFETPGEYIVTLIVSGPGGTAQAQKSIRVNPPPSELEAAFDILPQISSPLTIVLDSTSSLGVISGYLWDFGDGTTSTEANPQHTYAAEGVYTVTLTISGGGSTSSAAQQITVIDRQLPVADFLIFPPQGHAPLNVKFTDISNEGTAKIIDHYWDFGDGSASHDLHPTHTYALPGQYLVTLTVKDENGFVATNDHTINVTNPQLHAFFTVAGGGFTNTLFAFTDATQGVKPFSYSWDFGDGKKSSDVSPSHLYDFPGVYTVRLTVVDANSGSDTYEQAINVIAPDNVLALFGASPVRGIAPLKVNLTNTSIGKIASYHWDFGNNQTSAELSPSPVIYNQAGTYRIALVVTGENGQQSTFEKTVTVLAASEINIHATPLLGTAPLEVSLSGSSPQADDIYAWTWDLGNGATRYGQYATYVYSQPGIYTVTLNADGDEGTSTATTMIEVTSASLARAAFRASQYAGLIPMEVCFSAIGANDSSLYHWDLGDGETKSGFSAFCHDYDTVGEYPVVMTVNGLKASSTIYAFDANLGLSNIIYEIGDKGRVCFYNDTPDTSAYLWIFGDRTTSTEPSPCHDYSIGTFEVMVVVTPQNGKPQIFMSTITVLNGKSAVEESLSPAQNVASPVNTSSDPLNIFGTPGTLFLPTMSAGGLDFSLLATPPSNPIEHLIVNSPISTVSSVPVADAAVSINVGPISSPTSPAITGQVESPSQTTLVPLIVKSIDEPNPAPESQSSNSGLLGLIALAAGGAAAAGLVVLTIGFAPFNASPAAAIPAAPLTFSPHTLPIPENTPLYGTLPLPPITACPDLNDSVLVANHAIDDANEAYNEYRRAKHEAENLAEQQRYAQEQSNAYERQAQQCAAKMPDALTAFQRAEYERSWLQNNVNKQIDSLETLLAGTMVLFGASALTTIILGPVIVGLAAAFTAGGVAALTAKILEQAMPFLGGGVVLSEALVIALVEALRTVRNNSGFVGRYSTLTLADLLVLVGNTLQGLLVILMAAVAVLLSPILAFPIIVAAGVMIALWQAALDGMRAKLKAYNDYLPTFNAAETKLNSLKACVENSRSDAARYAAQGKQFSIQRTQAEAKTQLKQELYSAAVRRKDTAVNAVYRERDLCDDYLSSQERLSETLSNLTNLTGIPVETWLQQGSTFGNYGQEGNLAALEEAFSALALHQASPDVRQQIASHLMNGSWTVDTVKQLARLSPLTGYPFTHWYPSDGSHPIESAQHLSELFARLESNGVSDAIRHIIAQRLLEGTLSSATLEAILLKLPAFAAQTGYSMDVLLGMLLTGAITFNGVTFSDPPHHPACEVDQTDWFLGELNKNAAFMLQIRDYMMNGGEPPPGYPALPPEWSDAPDDMHHKYTELIYIMLSFFRKFGPAEKISTQAYLKTLFGEKDDLINLGISIIDKLSQSGSIGQWDYKEDLDDEGRFYNPNNVPDPKEPFWTPFFSCDADARQHMLLRWDTPGNIHFGFIGALIGLRPDEMYTWGRLSQPNGDDFGDVGALDAGIRLAQIWQNNGGKLTEHDLSYVLHTQADLAVNNDLL